MRDVFVATGMVRITQLEKPGDRMIVLIVSVRKVSVIQQHLQLLCISHCILFREVSADQWSSDILFLKLKAFSF